MNAAPDPSRGAVPPVPIGSIEDRRFPRFHIHLPSIKINDLGATWQGILAPVLDVSERGFRLRLPFVLAMGNSFNFELALPDGAGTVIGTAQCRWSRSDNGWLSWICGSEIIGINPADAGRWEAFILGLRAKHASA